MRLIHAQAEATAALNQLADIANPNGLQRLLVEMGEIDTNRFSSRRNDRPHLQLERRAQPK
jgi:hypothetical protein